MRFISAVVILVTCFSLIISCDTKSGDNNSSALLLLLAASGSGGFTASCPTTGTVSIRFRNCYWWTAKTFTMKPSSCGSSTYCTSWYVPAYSGGSCTDSGYQSFDAGTVSWYSQSSSGSCNDTAYTFTAGSSYTITLNSTYSYGIATKD
ncbi:MAG: hypothetical protein KA369_11320 [Spirochaetes bacterium]|nr:hypothetical protein [Spirochaetota bacterium]